MDWRQLLAFTLYGAGGGNPAQLGLAMQQQKQQKEADQYRRELSTAMQPQQFASPGGPDNPAPVFGSVLPDQLKVQAMLARAPQGFDTGPALSVMSLQQRQREQGADNAFRERQFGEQRRQFDERQLDDASAGVEQHLWNSLRLGEQRNEAVNRRNFEREESALNRQSQRDIAGIRSAGVGQDQTMPGWGLYSDPVANMQFRYNTRTGQAVTLDGQPYTPKSAVLLSQDPGGVFGASAARTSGGAAGTVASTLPQATVSYNNAVKVIDDFNLPQVKKQAPYALGVGGVLLPTVPGVNSDFNARVEQLRGIGFLQAYQSLKGGGPISEVEGTKATGAQMRLNQAQTESEWYAALKDAKALLDDAYGATQEIARRGSTAPQMQPQGGNGPQPIPSPAPRRRWNPKTGKIEVVQ